VGPQCGLFGSAGEIGIETAVNPPITRDKKID